MTKISIITVCDLNYLFHFDTFYKSFILNEVNSNVFYEHFYIYINNEEVNSFEKKYYFLKKFPNININFVIFNPSYCDSIKIFSGHFRFFAINKLLVSKKYDKLLYLDVDSYINKSIYNICNEIKEAMGLFLRINQKNNICEKITNKIFMKNNYNYKQHKLILSGSIFCNCNQECNKLISLIINNLLNIKFPKNFDNLSKEIKSKFWLEDQIQLENIFFCKNHNYNIYILPKVFLDLYCNSNSNIFFVKGKEAPWNSNMWQNIVKNTEVNFVNKYPKNIL